MSSVRAQNTEQIAQVALVRAGLRDLLLWPYCYPSSSSSLGAGVRRQQAVPAGRPPAVSRADVEDTAPPTGLGLSSVSCSGAWTPGDHLAGRSCPHLESACSHLPLTLKEDTSAVTPLSPLWLDADPIRHFPCLT